MCTAGSSNAPCAGSTFVITIASFVSFLKLYIAIYDNLSLDSHSTHKQMSFNVSTMMLTQHLKFEGVVQKSNSFYQ